MCRGLAHINLGVVLPRFCYWKFRLLDALVDATVRSHAMERLVSAHVQIRCLHKPVSGGVLDRYSLRGAVLVMRG